MINSKSTQVEDFICKIQTAIGIYQMLLDKINNLDLPPEIKED